ncbi:MAG: hypothetical protein EOO89_31320 [Pedobacter sp.]|nr:MAG: hypothetical protein EOO89_31320 [Pedobacter sp.]
MKPAFPMDGARMLRAVLSFKFNYLRATRIVSFFENTIAVLLLVIEIFTYSAVPAVIGVFTLLSSGIK